MRKLLFLVPLFIAGVAFAAVSVTGPTSLVTDPQNIGASEEAALFEFSFTADDEEILSSVKVTIESTTMQASDFASLAVYKDGGSGDYDSSDAKAGELTELVIGTNTIDVLEPNNVPGQYFVVAKTSSTLGAERSFTATMAEDAIVTSADPQSVTPATTAVITSSVVAPPSNGDNGNGDDDQNIDFGKVCAGGIINGKLYKIEESSTVYLAAACRLKPCKGAATVHARGHKFQDIQVLASLEGLTVSDRPALPSGGTLVKGSDKTVWFVTNTGKRKGFVSENAFLRLGFNFRFVHQVSDNDLATMPVDTPIMENSNHPDGTVYKCTVSPTVFELVSGKRTGFANANAFRNRGNNWEQVLNIDCSAFSYPENPTPITE
jgi:hypothetical protein